MVYHKKIDNNTKNSINKNFLIKQGFLRRWIILRNLINFSHRKRDNCNKNINMIDCNRGQGPSKYRILRKCIRDKLTNYKQENRWTEHAHNQNHSSSRKLKNKTTTKLL